MADIQTSSSGSRLEVLFPGYLNRTLSEQERIEFALLIKDAVNEQNIRDLIERFMPDIPINSVVLNEDTAAELVESILQSDKDYLPVKPVHRIHFLKTAWFKYAAAVIILFGLGAYLWTTNKKAERPLAKGNRQIQTDIAPGSNKAILTVGGKKIDLSSNKTGIAVGTAITYTDGERIANAGEMLELKTPRGGQYQALLPDGSKVWLNAASSIQFPSKFTGRVREVEINGEAYLEIAKNTKQPFVIHTNKTLVEVLGTSLNINSYADEGSIRTTLVEGSIRVGVNGQSVILKPGQQATTAVAVSSDRQLQDAAGIQVSANIDLDQALAWKNGIFNFEGVDLHSVMRQLERWYDIKVEYKGTSSNVIFKGEMYRNANLSDVLEAIQEMGVKFEIDGKRLIVF